MKVVVAVDQPHRTAIVDELGKVGHEVLAATDAAAPASVAGDDVALSDPTLGAHLGAAECVILQSDRRTLTAEVVAMCDRAGVRILALCEHPDDARIAATFGLTALSLQTEPWRIADGVGQVPLEGRAPDAEPARSGPGIITVWGAGGAPGRSTLAVEIAVELARAGSHVGLVDADSHAPSVALQLGLADEAPGFAAACRQAALGTLDARELDRISEPLGRTGVDVLTGINRPSRWPELSAERVDAALQASRAWADHTVVDVAGPIERDEEIVSDVDGLRRNDATLGALRAADLVVAVVGADPVGISRFLRAYPEVRAIVGTTPIAVVANRLRGSTLGIDARGQVRRTLDRFAGVQDVWFVPHDPRAADAALLAAAPVAQTTPRSALTQAVRRVVSEAIVPPARGESRRSRRRALKEAA